MEIKTTDVILDASSTHIHYLAHWEKEKPHKNYLIQPLPNGKVEHYTWAQVAYQVRCMATYINKLGLEPKSKIAIFGKNSAHWIMADLAIWLAGHISVPLYSTFNSEGIKYVLEHSEAKLLFIGKLDAVGDSWNEVKNVISKNMPCIFLPQAPEFDGLTWKEIVSITDPLKQIDFPNAKEVATIIYTSGSTGRPKGVMQSFETLLSPVEELKNAFEINSNDRLLSHLPLAHIAERILVQSIPIVNACTIYFSNSQETFIEDLKRAKPTVFLTVPRLWIKVQSGINHKISPSMQRMVFKLPILSGVLKKKLLSKLGLNHIRVALTGSAPLPASVIKWYRNLGLELLEIYGMTENCGYSHLTRVGQYQSGYVGHAHSRVECRIDSNGEILVKSPGTMLGYYKNSEKTAEDMTEDGFFRTGDMGLIDDTGCLKITGRVKDIFKTSKGKYVKPVPIEQKIAAHDFIESVCVGGSSQHQPVAFMMLAEEVRAQLNHGNKREVIELAINELKESINKSLEPHEKLGFMVVIDEPWTMENDLLTPTMKIKRNKIEEKYEPYLESWANQKRSIVWE
ncbi:AMP-binding protein [Acinetobacter sp. NBRC 110496]|uniref:AMP-binding protein n=1 Tax=Acinetobacter sp. NBRC 110496 TaxID=1550715 RepID=UPI0005C6ADD9|nr:AMP-binding protein [Acinetobacter sp. NBRC 110496]